MTVLDDILEWSKDRPGWQRDALRRLVQNGDLTEDDIRSLSEICKNAHGLAELQEVAPLAKGHIADKGPGSAQVTLLSIFHHRKLLQNYHYLRRQVYPFQSQNKPQFSDQTCRAPMNNMMDAAKFRTADKDIVLR